MSLAEMGQTYWQGVPYGPPGCGKTTLALGSVLPTFVYDVDQGLNAAIAWRKKQGLRMDTVLAWPVRTVADFDAATAWLVANMRHFVGGLIVVDSATELQRIVIQERVAKSGHMVPDQREWGDVRVLMEKLTVKFRYMPAHLVYCCHEMNKQDGGENSGVWRPSFDGKFGGEYAKHFSWIARLVAVHAPVLDQAGRPTADAAGRPSTQVIRALNFGPDPGIHFKDRSAAMAKWEAPHLDSLLQRMMSSTTGGPPAGPSLSA